MDVQSAIVQSLKEFYSVTEIRQFWKQAADALMSGMTTMIVINQTGFEGQTSAGIQLSTQEEKASFITACKMAINQLNGVSGVDPSSLGSPVSFAGRVLTV